MDNENLHQQDIPDRVRSSTPSTSRPDSTAKSNATSTLTPTGQKPTSLNASRNSTTNGTSNGSSTQCLVPGLHRHGTGSDNQPEMAAAPSNCPGIPVPARRPRLKRQVHGQFSWLRIAAAAL